MPSCKVSHYGILVFPRSPGCRMPAGGTARHTHSHRLPVDRLGTYEERRLSPHEAVLFLVRRLPLVTCRFSKPMWVKTRQQLTAATLEDLVSTYNVTVLCRDGLAGGAAGSMVRDDSSPQETPARLHSGPHSTSIIFFFIVISSCDVVFAQKITVVQVC